MRAIVVDCVDDHDATHDDGNDDASSDKQMGDATEYDNPDRCGAVAPPLATFSSSSSSSTSIAPPLEILRDALLRPGMKFVGRIFIPGTSSSATADNDNVDHQGEKSNAYEMSILNRDVDALGNDFVLAVHGAYDDEQVGRQKYMHIVLHS